MSQDENFTGIREAFEIAPCERHDTNPAPRFNGELAILIDLDSSAFYRISIRVVRDSPCEMRSAASGIALTSQEVQQVISGMVGRLYPDDSVAAVRRILSSTHE